MDECDGKHEDYWPNDDEANDVVLAQAATEDSYGSGSGCSGAVLILIVPLIALFYLSF